MLRRTHVVVLVLLLTACTTVTQQYRPSYPVVVQKGGRLEIDCGYEESLRYYDVTAYYVESAEVTCSLSSQDFADQKHEILTLGLITGDKLVFVVGGSYNLDPYMLDRPFEGFRFVATVDSFSVNDTIFLQSDSVEAIFYYERIYPFMLIQSGYTNAVEGFFVITNVRNNTLSGIIRLSGETQGYYIGNKIIDNQTTSWVSGEMRFEATERKIEQKSHIIGTMQVGLKTREAGD
jgi:hypothetical protein